MQTYIYERVDGAGFPGRFAPCPTGEPILPLGPNIDALLAVLEHGKPVIAQCPKLSKPTPVSE
jgi:hypothetical protein